MFNYCWPIGLVVIANVAYHICAKEIPGKINPFASLTITYLVGAVISVILYFALNKHPDLITDIRRLNWAPYVLGIAIVGLEAGSIFAYKAGWPISVEQIVQGAVLAVILIFVGFFLYNEGITWNKIAGIVICLGGLALINMK